MSFGPALVRQGRSGEAVPAHWLSGTMKQVTDRATVSHWLAGYEAAWRTPG
jgi:hypothetical protein